MRRASLLLAAIVLLAGCTGRQLAADPTESVAESASTTARPEPTPAPTPTHEPTPRPTPEPEADLRRGAMTVVAWMPQFGDSPWGQVFVEIVNDGDGWAELQPGDSDFTILDANGGLVTTGFFIYAYPEILGPGETGYLAMETVGDPGQSPEDFVTVEAEGGYDPVREPDVTFEFADVQWRQDEFSGGMTAAGFLTATADVEDAVVGVFCIGPEGTPLGFSYTNLVQNITAGERKAFETVGSTPPLTADRCVETKVFASDTGF